MIGTQLESQLTQLLLLLPKYYYLPPLLTNTYVAVVHNIPKVEKESNKRNATAQDSKPRYSKDAYWVSPSE